MRNADIILNIHQKRGAERLPLERVYRHLFDPELFLRAYGKIYRNQGAMTKGTTKETVDGMSLQKIHTIIGLLQMERYKWTPVRRTYIEKANGKMRPLGIPIWSDKLLEEVLRMLLEPYYEQIFSDRSHGFRPNRGCHSALHEIWGNWKGTVWFIEGDIKGCFDNIDHEVLLEIIRRDIHDGRLLNLLKGLLEAGYLENWRYHDTLSGTPQGGIISPLLANIYLNDLDKYVEDTLIPTYSRGNYHKRNPEYVRLERRIKAARENSDFAEVKCLTQARRRIPWADPKDPSYRRLRYIRYADDFLLGFVGPKDEADDIRSKVGEFLERRLKLTLSAEKTLITHAGDEKAKFLGYEINVIRTGSRITRDESSKVGRRAANGSIALWMPRKVAQKYLQQYSKKGKITHRSELIIDTDYTILQRYQSVLRGVYNFYCMAINVDRRMRHIRWILETSLTKTLASKFKSKVSRIYRKYQVVDKDGKKLQVVINRPDKKPLIAVYGGIKFERIPEGMGSEDFRFKQAWFAPGGNRSEVVQRLFAGKCELCGWEGQVEKLQVHHIRKLADIDRPGRQPKATWEKIMSARKRKTLVVCKDCHNAIHTGRHDGSKR